ncbi:Chloroperoxidase [Mycena galericulata]|nr:Chloroperoxidase [Mycena galericulata]
MKTITLFLVVAAVTTTDALSPSLAPLDPGGNHDWIEPTATDVRSPCPGLNTLANHGYLPRTGKNISIPMILNAASDAFNINADTILPFAKFGLLSGNEDVSLTLDALKLHGLLEHDASISRGDAALGDNLHFNETLFTVLADANPGVDYYNVTSAGQVMHARLADSLANNPNVTSTPKELILRSGESAVYLSVMGDPLTGVAKKEEERLPVAEGWKKPATTITAQTNQALANQIIQVANDSPTQMSNFSGLIPFANSKYLRITLDLGWGINDLQGLFKISNYEDYKTRLRDHTRIIYYEYYETAGLLRIKN